MTPSKRKKNHKRLTRHQFVNLLDKEIEAAKKTVHHAKSFGDETDLIQAQAYRVGLKTARDMANRMFE